MGLMLTGGGDEFHSPQQAPMVYSDDPNPGVPIL